MSLFNVQLTHQQVFTLLFVVCHFVLLFLLFVIICFCFSSTSSSVPLSLPSSLCVYHIILPPLSSLYCPPLFLFLRETNLKVRQALPVTGDLGEDSEKLADFNGKTTRVQPTVGFSNCKRAQYINTQSVQVSDHLCAVVS